MSFVYGVVGDYGRRLMSVYSSVLWAFIRAFSERLFERSMGNIGGVYRTVMFAIIAGQCVHDGRGLENSRGLIVGRYDIVATCTYLSMGLSYVRTVIHTHTGMQTAM